MKQPPGTGSLLSTGQKERQPCSHYRRLPHQQAHDSHRIAAKFRSEPKPTDAAALTNGCIKLCPAQFPVEKSPFELFEDSRINAGSREDPAPESALNALADYVLPGEIEPLDRCLDLECVAQNALRRPIQPIEATLVVTGNRRRC